MKRLFDPSKNHLSVCDRINKLDPEGLGFLAGRSKHPTEARATPLHYAAVYNKDHITAASLRCFKLKMWKRLRTNVDLLRKKI
jgi:hypothetical protein